jgi:hypothetical protein
MTFKVVIATMAGHDLNHLKQLETITARVSAKSTKNRPALPADAVHTPAGAPRP